jgi:hypothetical protein
MARYSAFLGRRVEVQYRAGDIFLPATGTLAADSGRSIFLEEHFVKRGQEKHFRWEIPYPCIMKIEEKSAEAELPRAASVKAPAAISATAADSALDVEGGHGSLIPLHSRPEEA